MAHAAVRPMMVSALPVNKLAKDYLVDLKFVTPFMLKMVTVTSKPVVFIHYHLIA